MLDSVLLALGVGRFSGPVFSGIVFGCRRDRQFGGQSHFCPGHFEHPGDGDDCGFSRIGFFRGVAVAGFRGVGFFRVDRGVDATHCQEYLSRLIHIQDGFHQDSPPPDGVTSAGPHGFDLGVNFLGVSHVLNFPRQRMWVFLTFCNYFVTYF